MTKYAGKGTIFKSTIAAMLTVIWYIAGWAGIGVWAASIYFASVAGALIPYVAHNFEDIHWGTKPELDFETAVGTENDRRYERSLRVAVCRRERAGTRSNRRRCARGSSAARSPAVPASTTRRRGSWACCDAASRASTASSAPCPVPSSG